MQLIHTPIPSDLTKAAQDIHEGVQSGEITGLGVVVVLRNRRFFVDVFGALVREPHASRGYVAALDDCLKEIGYRARNTNTTI